VTIAQAQRIKDLFAQVEQQAKQLEDLKQRIEKIEAQRKPGRPPKNG
jgi:ubiquinone biosynthesis protein UbiJ